MSRIHFKLTLPIDVVLFADPADPWGKIQDQFVDAIITQLSAMDKCIQRYTNGKTVPMPQAFHFELPEKTTLTTVIYPAGISDETLEPQRKELHALLGLDNKPFFRRSMAFCFPSDEMKAKYLRNVHKYIPTLNPDEFQIFGVHGSYIFHHCMQDNENDAEWGALYRCFQVIISWFNCQGYINKPTPMVTEMQDILTKFDEGFVNVVEEKDWIPLEQMVAILNAFSISTTTKDIRPEVDEPIDLSIHFKEQGTPVAFTAESTACVVLGIAVNEEANIKKLLVLDTGYTGNDDLASITEKAVDWKDEEFLMGLEAYGICLPQRPDGV
ncbi:ufm1-specific protease 2-like [Chiloscyllium plagiosum]|uniref:ufm1-specific protease 2-like n=1 Tax=Chiloscyllium plagiosum TaxID=36176 RepID=UPI001CB7E3CC|nr:ufm1-specific protease 2-like [Chiloscyllium plagiosum]